MMMKAKEGVGLRGRLKISAFGLPLDCAIKNREPKDDSDRIIVVRHDDSQDVHIEGHNIIVNTGRERVIELLGGLSSNAFINMGIGDDGASALDLLVPVAPVITDTDLGNRLATQAISSITSNFGGSPPQYYGEFIETFTASDYLGSPALPWLNPSDKVVNECGLFTTDNVMLARKTFASIPFDPATAVAIQFLWDILIS
jgi:hypothetical protein